MSSPALTTNTKSDTSLETQRVAWLVLWLAFTVFCLLCATTSFGVYYYFYRSTIPLTATTQVTRGYVKLIRTDLSESFEAERRTLSRGERVITDSQSQAVIIINDSQNEAQLVAAVTVKNNSEVIVRNLLQPRFDRSRLGYSITLYGVEGEIDVFLPASRARDAVLTIFLEDDVVVDISESGSYTLSFSNGQVELATWGGQAAILPPDRASSRPVVDGQFGLYDRETDELRVEQRYVNLIENSAFSQAPAEGFTGGGAQSPALPTMEEWNCSDRTDNSPTSIFEPVFFDGRQTLRMFRGTGTQSHGETTCIQPFGPSGQVGRRVDHFNSLEIRTTFYIESHSLDVCGVAGSECPMMLLMDYVDENGRSNQWFHGFYSRLNPGSDYPLTCVSCSQDHKRINGQTWYTYESGNLFTLLPEGARPASILNMRFYASGHDYDIYVADVSLLASPPDPSGETENVTASGQR